MDFLVMTTEGQKVAITLQVRADGSEHWWAECLLCPWVSTSNPDRRHAEQAYGRHHEREHVETAR